MLCYYGGDFEKYRKLCIWEGNIKTDLRVDIDVIKWMELSQNKDHKRDLNRGSEPSL